jgi:hypothetical protein
MFSIARQIKLLLERSPTALRGLQHPVRALAVALLIAIGLVSLGPANLRVETGLNPDVERFGAFLGLGAALTFASARRLVLAATVLLVIIAGFEIVQELIPGRHGRFLDFFIKGAGAVVGIRAAHVIRCTVMRRSD